MNGVIGITFNKMGRLLLVKRRDIPVWVFPGGGIEKDENPLQAVRREVLEETGFGVKVIKKVAEYKYKNSAKKNIIFECKVTSGKPYTGSESKDVRFFSPNHLPQPRHPMINVWLADLYQKQKGVVKKEIDSIKVGNVIKYITKYPIPVLRFILYKFGLRINT